MKVSSSTEHQGAEKHQLEQKIPIEAQVYHNEH